MDPITQVVNLGKLEEFFKENDPNKEEQIPATQDDVTRARHRYQEDPTEQNGQVYVKALRQCGHHSEADDFAKKNLKQKPKFTIEGF